jgi:hypothetical protein
MNHVDNPLDIILKIKFVTYRANPSKRIIGSEIF